MTKVGQIDELISFISHEIRSPLQAVVGFSSALTDGLAGAMDEKQERCVRQIYESGLEISRFLSDLSALARLSAGTMPPNPQTVVVTDTLTSIVTRVGEFTHSRNVIITLEVEPDVAALRLEVPYFENIVENLLLHAVDCTSDDGQVNVLVGKNRGETSFGLTVRYCDNKARSRQLDALLTSPLGVADIASGEFRRADIRFAVATLLAGLCRSRITAEPLADDMFRIELEIPLNKAQPTVETSDHIV